jgi:hypothetical protein
MIKRLSLALAGFFVLATSASGAGTLPGFSLSQQMGKDGKPLAGCILKFYQAGTVGTPQTAYQDSGLTIPVIGGSQVTCDTYGRLSQFFLADGSIKILLTDKNGVTQVTADGLLVIGASSGGVGGSPVDPTTVLATGDMKVTYGVGVLSGFVRANGRTIGSATSGGTERANSDTQSLFLYLWGADTNLAVSGGRGASAAADWAANKTIALPDWRGRVMAGLDDMGNSSAGRLTATYFGATGGCSGSLGTTLGAACGGESQTLTAGQIPAITSNGTTSAPTVNVPGGKSLASYLSPASSSVNSTGSINGAYDLGGSSNISFLTSLTGSGGTASVTSNNAGGGAHPIVQPTMLATFYIKL